MAVDRRSVGRTLRTRIELTRQDVVNGMKLIRFRGKLISVRQSKELAKLRNGNRYVLHVSKEQRLDCYDTAHTGMCLASMSNSPTGLVHKSSGMAPEPNARLTSNPKDPSELWLILIKPILPHQEIFWRYGSSYKLGE